VPYCPASGEGRRRRRQSHLPLQHQLLLADLVGASERPGPGPRRQQEDDGWQAPAGPEGVDQVTWERLMQRAKRAFPVYRGIANAVPPWSPLMEGPADEN
jgi:hypothetical protein